MEMNDAWITNDAVVFGLLMLILGWVFKTSTSENPFWQKFYTYVPSVLVCYFLPSVLNSLGIISGEKSNLYFVASRYMLPASLVLLTLSTDFKEIKKLGSKAIIMFLTGTLGIVIGGPVSILFFSWVAPGIVGGEFSDVWRGMTTIAGSWIGGSANQAAMKEVFEVDGELFSKMVTVDILVANVWLAVLLIGAGRSKQIDALFKADASAIEQVKNKIEKYQLSIARVPSLGDLMMILAIGSAVTGLSHFLADIIAPYIGTHYPVLADYSLTSSFFWLVVIATTVGLVLSFTKLRNLEGAGASKIGSVFIYILVATVGMQMDVLAIIDSPGLFLVGIVWMMVHIGLLLLVARLIKAPFFFVSVGSQANVGGAASAPIVAAAFHPSLAPVGVLLAVLGYALGTYAAYICGVLMQMAAGV
ncbi:DUF819 family protein [Reichenbachiella agarivorans]|uniref:DUF819 family protein n=1 Tax=Reichenbachiella agarivorans TaxID=2979464 RepID=A0ABY6CQD4_9BACT|nr:DUF819 family protein [Reichenbachiella agarivorans]UXP32009.1 DUF819 family protein [Reichenbachiella agarivorans]